MAAAKKVVIVGGGIAGQMTAQALLKKIGKKGDITVTIVNANTFQEFPVAATVFLARPETHGKFVSPNPDSFKLKGVEYEFGTVDGVEDGSVRIKGGKTVPFDALVLAVGWHMPLVLADLGISHADRVAEVKKASAAIKAADRVLVAGGGAVGLELLGDLRETSSAKFTLACSTAAPLPYSDKKYQDKVMKKLAEWGVQVLVNDRVVSDEKKPVYTRNSYAMKSGATIEADVYIPAYSQGPRTGFLKDGPYAKALNDGGFVDVNEHQQAKAYAKLFAVNCSSVKEGGYMAKMEGQANTVGANIAAFLRDTPLQAHKEGMPDMKHPPVQVLGHRTFALVEAEMCGGAGCCCRCCGFPFCPPPCCWCCCQPCCWGLCCGSPEGAGTAKCLGALLPMFSKKSFKGVGEAPKQQTMGQTIGKTA